MRYSELLKEDDANSITNNIKNDIIDIIVNLKSQGINSITIPQILDILRTKNEYNGIALDQNIVNQTLNKVKNVSVKPDIENENILTVYINTPGNLQRNSRSEKEKNEDKVNNMAKNTIKNSLKGD